MPRTRRRASTHRAARRRPCGRCRAGGRWSRRCRGRTRAAPSSLAPSGPGLYFARHVGAQRRLRGRSRAQAAHAGDAPCAGRARSRGSSAASRAARADRRERMRDMAARFGPQLADREREARERMRLAAGHVGRQRRDVELDVGRRRLGGTRAHEAAALVDADRQRAAAPEQPCGPMPALPQSEFSVVVGRDRLRAFVDQRGSADGPAGSRRPRARRHDRRCRAAAAAPPGRCPRAAAAAATGSRRPARMHLARARDACARSLPRLARSATPTARAARRTTMRVAMRVGLDRAGWARRAPARGRPRPRCSASRRAVVSW